ncbi:MAG: hypothetical protein HY976_04180 [Candidatus Kerfeldbacteria bacterium]|nr:hypothetical protein [Candidatus Kerfeldbacteria bacterium]
MIKHSFLTKRAIKKLQRGLAILGVFALTFSMVPVTSVNAATITSAKDVLSTLVDSANANHTLSWVSPSGVANGSTIVLTFASGFSLTGVVEDDIDIAGSTEGELTTAGDCTSTEKAGVVVSGQTITFTLCSGDGGDFTNSETITIEIGTNATASGTGANQINNQTSAQNNLDPTIDITSGASDTGSVAVEVIADDSVNITATVDPSITFSITDTTIGFGTLSASAPRYATADTLGTGSNTAGHQFTIGTNAASGFAITYSGALLTSAGNTISAATIAGDIDGTQGTEQFAIAFDELTTSILTIASGYEEESNNLKFDTTGAPTQNITVISRTSPAATTTVDAHYLANINANTEAGSYTTDITYIATGTF